VADLCRAPAASDPDPQHPRHAALRPAAPSGLHHVLFRRSRRRHHAPDDPAMHRHRPARPRAGISSRPGSLPPTPDPTRHTTPSVTRPARREKRTGASGGPPLPQRQDPPGFVTLSSGHLRWRLRSRRPRRAAQNPRRVQGDGKRCPLAPAVEPLQAQARRRDRSHHLEGGLWR